MTATIKKWASNSNIGYCISKITSTDPLLHQPAATRSAHVEEPLLMPKIRLSSALFSSIALVFISVSFLYSSISFCVLASFSSASSLHFLRSSISPCTTALASAASSSRSSLSFDDDDLEDATGLMPTLLRKWFELFWESTWDTTYTLDTVVSPSATGSALKASIFD